MRLPLVKKAWNFVIMTALLGRAVSSAEEHRSYTPGVAGSNPAPPILYIPCRINMFQAFIP
jgi:hypothetical protein